MSKVNIDEIKVGDLVETMYGQERWLCYVTRLDIKNERYKGIWSDNFKEEWDHMDDLTGHWKVINFDELPESPFTEEESKMDELKVYTGKETIEALLEGKVLKHAWNNHHYKIVGDKLFSGCEGANFDEAAIVFSNLLETEFTEVETPQVGDWVRVTYKSDGQQEVSKVDELEDNKMWANWDGTRRSYFRVDSTGITWEILSPEQVSEYKRDQAFVKVGRKPNEFKSDDIVFVGVLCEVAVVISKENSGEFIKVHLINKTDGFKAKPHQLTPIAFVEQQVDLS